MRRSFRFVACLAALLAAPFLAFGQNDPIPVASPDGQIELRLFLSKPDDSRYFRLAYQVSYRGKLLMDTSLMGLTLQNQEPVLGDNLGLTATVRDAGDHYNSLVAQYIQNGSLGRRISVEARAYNDGVAFRYYLSKTPQTDDLRIEEELTDFRFAQDGDAYSSVRSSYESDHSEYSRTRLSGIQRTSLMALPFLIEQPGVGWVAITEAQLDNYPGMNLFHAGGNTIRTTLAPRADDAALAMHGAAPAETPWRVLMIASEPRKLLESDIVQNLNPASAIADTSWIKPVKEYVPIQYSADLADHLQEELARAEKAGAAGVSIDLMHRADQRMIALYRRAAKAAAEHHLMIEFLNGPTPDGIERTWPNVVTHEDTPFRRLLNSF
jgi:alpha-glucosidase